MNRAIICDIDQCLLDSLQPLLLMESGQRQGLSPTEYWDLFYNNLHLCKRNEWCFELLDKLTVNNDITVLFITGREEKARKVTESFLKFNTNFKYKLFMRPNNNFDNDYEVKKRILEAIMNYYDVIFALDDREDNCQMFRSFGITTLKVDSLELH